MTNKLTVEQLIKHTDALIYVNALKAALSELKEEMATIQETREYQDAAIERARRIMRRLDNQYRAIVRSATAPNDPKDTVEEDWSVLSDEEVHNG